MTLQTTTKKSKQVNPAVDVTTGASHKEWALSPSDPLHQPCVQALGTALWGTGELFGKRAWESKGTGKGLQNLIYEKRLKEFNLFSLRDDIQSSEA